MRRERWQCKPCDKTSFPSARQAQGAIDYIRTIRESGYIPKRAYPCEYGNGWHLTSKEERKTV